MKGMRSGFALAGLLVALPAGAMGQGFFVGGGVVMPSGDYADFAKTGYGGMAGVNLSFPALPIGGRVEALYLYNSHDETIDAGSTSLYGGMASATYGIGGPTGLYLLGSLGYMNHHYNAPSGGTSASEWDFTWGLGGGINFSKLFAEVRYMQRGDTKFIPIMVGIKFGG